MKATIIALSTLVALSSMHANASSETSRLNGAWTLVDRICTDDQPAKDRIKMGRDRIAFTMKDGHMTTELVIENEVSKRTVGFTATKYLLTTFTEDNGLQTVGYTLSADGELVVVSAGFGKGGTCNEGEALLTVFKRK